MKNIKIISGTLTIVKRLKGSESGNPRFLISINNNEYSTTNDAMFGYSVQNYENKMVLARVGIHYKKPSIESAVILCENDRMKMQSCTVSEFNQFNQ